MSVLSARGLGKRYGQVRALHDADVDLKAGEIVALVGANGAGKSTLVKILSGYVSQDEGTATVDGDPLGGGVRGARAAGIAVVHQELTLVPTASVAENVFLWRLPRTGTIVRRREMNRQARAVLDDIGVDLDVTRPARECTAVQQRLVMVAAAISQQARILFLDEPTAALPPDEARHVLDVAKRLRSLGKTVVFVSHRLGEVCDLCDRAIVMRDGQTIGELAGDTLRQDTMMELIGGRRLAELDRAEKAREAPAEHRTLMDVRGLTGPRVHDVDLQVRAGEIVGIAGLVGSGRSELLRLLAGVQRPSAGALGEGGGPSRGYVGEDRSKNLFGAFDVAGNVSLPSLRRFLRGRTMVKRSAERRAATEVIDQLRVKGDARSAVWALSGGNKQKVLLGRWVMSGVDVLLLDEPTVGIDVGARAEVHHLLREVATSGRGVVVTIADPKELLSLCDRVVVLCEGGVTLETSAPFDEREIVSAFYAREPARDAVDA